MLQFNKQNDGYEVDDEDEDDETASEEPEQEDTDTVSRETDVYIAQKPLRVRAGCTMRTDVVGRLTKGTHVRMLICQKLPSGVIRAKVIAGALKGWVTMETRGTVLLKPAPVEKTVTDTQPKGKKPSPTEHLPKTIIDRIAKMKLQSEEDAATPDAKTGGPKDLLGSDDICCNIAGPILFTAANGQITTKVFSSGRTKQQAAQLHTTELAIRCANAMKKLAGVGGSFCVWNPMASFDGGNYDPNYLAPELFEDSPFHNFLHRFIKDNQGMPLLHVDLLGKKNKVGKNGVTVDIDVGTGPIDEEWDDSIDPYGLVQGIQKQFKAQMMKGLSTSAYKTPPFRRSKKQHQYGVETDPNFDGFWGSDVYTTANQSVCLGIPAFHLKMPDYFRRHLLKDVKLFGLFAESLANVYKNVIVPWWTVHTETLKKKIFFNAMFAKEVQPRNLSPEQCVSLYRQLGGGLEVFRQIFDLHFDRYNN